MQRLPQLKNLLKGSKRFQRYLITALLSSLGDEDGSPTFQQFAKRLGCTWPHHQDATIAGLKNLTRKLRTFCLIYRRVSIKAKAAHSDTQNCPSMWHVRFQTCGSKTSAEQERRMDKLISLGQHGGLAEATGALRIYLHAKVGPNSHCQEETCATV